MDKKKIIVGMRSLSEIRDKGGIYIDKTRFIDYLENNAVTSVPVFLRPRRFGKSLTASMLHCYYDIAKKIPSKRISKVPGYMITEPL